MKYAFENNWIPPVARVLVGLLSGIAFILLGEYVRRSQSKYSQILSAAGLGLFYLSIYGAYGYYNLVSAGTSFLFMIAVTIFGVILSVQTDSMALAALSTAAGFLVPYLFGLQAASDFGYFIYALALNVGILAVSFFKKWRRVAAIGFVGTVLNFAAWYGYYYSPDKFAIAVYALVVFYLIYLVSSISHNFIADETSDQLDLIILTLNPLWFFFELYQLAQPGSDFGLSVIAVAMSGGYLLLAYLFRVYRNDDRMFSLFLGGVSALFLTIAIPLRFSQNATTIAWAVEASLLAMLGAVTGNDGLKKASIGIFGLALVRFFLFDNFNYYEDLRTWLPIFNKQFFTYLILIFSGITIAYLFGHLMGEEYRSDKRVIGALWFIVNLLILFSITSEINRYFDQASYNLSNEINQETQVLTAQNAQNGVTSPQIYNDVYNQIGASERYNAINNERNAGVSIFWAVYAVILITLGIIAENSMLRKSALVLFAITIFKVFVVDLSGLETPYRIISFLALGVILLSVSYLYFKHQSSIEKIAA